VVRSVYEDSEDNPELGSETLADWERRMVEDEEDDRQFREEIGSSRPPRESIWKKDVEQMRWTLANAEAQAKGGARCLVVKPFHELHPGDCPAPLQQIPDDVQPDYLAAAREMCALILANPFKRNTRDVRRTRKEAHRILADLDGRFGKPLAKPDVSYVTWKEPPPPPKPEKLPELSPEAVAIVKARWDAAMDKRKDAS
jgi:hypothetical protein